MTVELMKMKHVGWAAVLLMIATQAEPCTISRPVSPEEVVSSADAIVRVTALEYARAPQDPSTWTTGEPDSQVRFRVIETLKGRDVPSVVVLPGYLVDDDDFNELKVPYTFVRRGGRSGSCFANAYRRNGEFLLMLKRRSDGSYTVNWYALGPVNEQLRGEDDAWLLWVRERTAKCPSCAGSLSPRSGAASDAIRSKRMPDGKEWTTENLNLPIANSYCYADAELNCRKYGRLYRWRSAQRACRSLGDGWRLPGNDEWRELANLYGGIRGASPEAGRAAYTALSKGGSSGFDARLGGGRAPDAAEYARLDAHGFYWTSSETGPSTAWFYNFGKGQLSLGRHHDGEKRRAFSVRCVRD